MLRWTPRGPATSALEGYSGPKGPGVGSSGGCSIGSGGAPVCSSPALLTVTALTLSPWGMLDSTRSHILRLSSFGGLSGMLNPPYEQNLFNHPSTRSPEQAVPKAGTDLAATVLRENPMAGLERAEEHW